MKNEKLPPPRRRGEMTPPPAPPPRGRGGEIVAFKLSNRISINEF